MVFERIIRVIGSRPTNYPFMSFDGDSVSRYYSAMSGPQTPAAQLRALVRTYPSALVGYSGGVDSALLAVVLRQELGRERMLAGVGRSASYPAAQWATARAVAQRFDIPLVELDTHELEDPDYLANPTNRCFFCKTELWRRLVPAARRRGLAIVCDGTNADDLRQLGVTGDLRVRHHGDRGGARIEVEARWVPWVTERLPAIKERLTALGFAVVEVAPRGYRRGGLLAERAERA